MTILDRKLRRDLWRSKGMLAAIISIIAVGISCLVGFQATFQNLEIAKADYYARCRMADFWVDLKKAPSSQIDRLAGRPGISELRQRISLPVVLDFKDSETPVSGLLISLPADPAPVINGIIIMRGSYFTGERQNEVIVSDAFAQARNVGVGDDLYVIMNRQRKRLYVAGTAISSEYTYLTPPGSIVPSPADYGVLYIKQDYAAEILDFEGATNNMVGLLTPEARQMPQAVLDDLEARLKPYGVFSVTPLDQQASNLALSSEMEGLKLMATMMPIIFLGVAALVLNVLMTRLTEEQRSTVGTLKALGYRNREIFIHFLKIGLAVGLAGALLGSILGYLVSTGMTMVYQTIFHFPRLVNRIYPEVMSIGLAVSLFFSLLGTMRGVRRVVNMNPAEAMRQSMPLSGGAILLERWQALWTRLGFRVQMVLRNLFRNKSRTAVSVFAAAMGASLVVFTLGSLDSFNYMIDFQFDGVMLNDYSLSFRAEQDYGAVFEVKKQPGVVRVEPVLDVACTFYNGNLRKKGMIQGLIEDATLTVPRDTDGQKVRLPRVGLLMTRRMAVALNLTRGDTVRVVPAKGDQRPVEVVIADVVDSVMGLAVYADFDYLNRLTGESASLTSLQVKAYHTPRERSAFLKTVKEYPDLQYFGDIQQQRYAMEVTFLEKMQGMIVPMIMFGAVIFLGSILNSSLIAILQRQREIATLRVLGYHPREVGSIFMTENLVQNIAGAVIGLPLGWGMLKGLAVMFSNDLYSMPCVVYPASYIQTLLLAVLFVLISQVVIQRAISKLDWHEALKMKE